MGNIRECLRDIAAELARKAESVKRETFIFPATHQIFIDAPYLTDILFDQEKGAVYGTSDIQPGFFNDCQ